VVCPLCEQRRARRACPALGHEICAVCCGTKRLTEIRCPDDCPYLAAAREHPAAAIVRQHDRDLGVLVQAARGFNERQSHLFVTVATFLVRHDAPALQPLIDEDVTEAVAALAATFETAARGVIYEHRSASLPASRLMSALRPLLSDAAGTHPGSAFERDAAVVLRRLEEAARDARTSEPSNRRALIEMLGRMVRMHDEPAAAAESPAAAPPRIIIP
jgi:hypothetical protein